MILPFKPQFKPLILDGTKIHTIREDKHDRWKVGMKIHMATGVRTKNYKQFAEATVSEISTIEIKWYGSKEFSNRAVQVKVNETNITNTFDTLDLLVKNDGFSNRQDFFAWFNEDFTGKLIYWENLKIIE